MGPGDPAAHRTDCLPLLPSGPGGVHRVLLHRAQPLILDPDPSTRSTRQISPSAEVTVQRKGTDGIYGARYGGSAICVSTWRDLAIICFSKYGGEGGIRTHGPVAGTHAFQACRFVHSRTSPHREGKGNILACVFMTGKVTGSCCYYFMEKDSRIRKNAVAVSCAIVWAKFSMRREE